MFKLLSQIFGALAALASLSFVGYEMKRNNDIAVVQSQFELLAIQGDLRSWLNDRDTLRIVMTRDIETLSEEEKLLFVSTLMAWFDLYELVYLARDRDVLTREQFAAWENGLCTLPAHWLKAFDTMISKGNYLEPLVEGVRACVHRIDHPMAK